MKIKCKVLTAGCEPVIIEKGDWIDLVLAEDITLPAPKISRVVTKKDSERLSVDARYKKLECTNYYLPLGVAMKLPEGYEAVILPRSSTFKKYGIILSNSQGIIDNAYGGNNDEWKAAVIPLKDTTINKGTRIVQFKIQLSQKATMWQKLKWLFSSKIEFEYVEDLESNDRGGFGSTGDK